MFPNRLAFAVSIFLAIGCLHPATIRAQSTPSNNRLTNRDVIDLVSDGFSPNVIKAKIASSSCQFDTTVEALKSLKRENVPQEVILAMVQAQAPAVGSTSSPKLRTIECVKGETQAILWVAPGKMDEVSRLRCHDQVTILVESPPWAFVKTEAGLTGYISASYINGQNTPVDPLLGPAWSQADNAAKQRQEPKRPAPPVRTVPSQPIETRPNNCSPAVESTISGEFSGWEGETIFKLDNGQIWEQAEYDYTYDYEYRPDVTIYQTSLGCRMKVEGVEETILVRRIK
jgi:hypothetical protein